MKEGGVKPYYKHAGITIYHGNCSEILPEIGKVDCLITDPPYGIGFKYKEKEKDNNPNDYWKWFKPIYKKCLALCNKGSFVAIWQSNQYMRYAWDWFGDDIRIYSACKNFVQLRKTLINYGYDPVVMKYTDWTSPLRPKKPERSIDFYVANTAKFVSEKNSLAGQHPCPRPIDQVVEIVKNFSAGIILDPFTGSGTTLVAAKLLGRKAMGIEIEEKYCEIAAKKLSQEVLSFKDDCS